MLPLVWMPRRTLDLDEPLPLRPIATGLVHGIAGAYRLERLLGEGGVGEVWLAEQDAPVRRQVAIKLIKPGMDSRRVVARFEAERQALALMSHPSIAKVFDGGSTDEGRPYFVMEYVDGRPINDHCDGMSLSLAGRLRLFREVCDAVQHAHQKGVIHRDLKPSNVLVAGSSPRVIDFGIAKAISEPLTGNAFNTEAGTLLGTPEYMSPEQAETGSDDIDTRADVYSLGAMLYEISCGTLPIASDKLRRRSLEELRRRIREDEPQPPSVRFRALPDREAVASRRSTTVEALRRDLSGDLDAIVMKAMEKDRNRRYGSASDLAADLERLLANEPVLARPQSTFYRVRKYALRHRTGFAFAAAAALVLPAFVVGLAFQVRQVSRERDRANREAAASRRVADFMANMFSVADPSQNRGEAITAHEVLDKATAEIGSSLSEDRAMRSRMMTTMGTVYTNLGLYPKAHPLLETALAERRGRLGVDDPETLESSLAMAQLMFNEGNLPGAEALYLPTLAAQRRVLGQGGAANIAASMNGLSAIHNERGQHREAEQLDREALQLTSTALGPEHRATITALNGLAASVYYQARYAESEAVHRRVVELDSKVLGPSSLATLKAISNLVADLSMERKFTEAEPLVRELIERQRQVLGPDHSATLTAKYNLAHILMSMQRTSEAEPLVRENLATARRVLGPRHQDTLRWMDMLGRIFKRQKHYAEAEQILTEAIDLRVLSLGPHSSGAADSRYNLACSQALGGRRQEAIATLRTALDGLPAFELRGIADDPDFEPLKGTPEFAALVADAKQRAAK
jgi:serine/threonine protein kinase